MGAGQLGKMQKKKGTAKNKLSTHPPSVQYVRASGTKQYKPVKKKWTFYFLKDSFPVVGPSGAIKVNKKKKIDVITELNVCTKQIIPTQGRVVVLWTLLRSFFDACSECAGSGVFIV